MEMERRAIAIILVVVEDFGASCGSIPALTMASLYSATTLVTTPKQLRLTSSLERGRMVVVFGPARLSRKPVSEMHTSPMLYECDCHEVAEGKIHENQSLPNRR